VQPHFLSNEFLAAGLRYKKEEMNRLNWQPESSAIEKRVAAARKDCPAGLLCGSDVNYRRRGKRTFRCRNIGLACISGSPHEYHGNLILIGPLKSRVEAKQRGQGHVLLGYDHPSPIQLQVFPPMRTAVPGPD